MNEKTLVFDNGGAMDGNLVAALMNGNNRNNGYMPDGYGERGGEYGSDGYGERRGVRGTGPYSRFRR